MHNVSKKEIQNLAHELTQIISEDNTSLLLEKARYFYEKTVLFDYVSSQEKVDETGKEFFNEKKLSENIVVQEETPDQKTDEIKEEKELSVQERIAEIMQNAPKLHEKQESLNLFHDTTPPDTLAKPISDKKTSNENTDTPVPESETTGIIDNSEESDLLKTSLEEEFKDAISADYAADLFVKAEKEAPVNKSLNDLLSQTQIQIGLNDRIAFVKHLFGGSQVEFNRVLSQLNSFSSEEQAKNFIMTRVKPDYNWDAEDEYEARFMQLIERRFM